MNFEIVTEKTTAMMVPYLFNENWYTFFIVGLL